MGVTRCPARVAQRVDWCAVSRAAREAALVASLYLAYALSRTLARGDVDQALRHANAVWHLEHTLQLPSEALLQQVALRSDAVIEVANQYYAVVHLPLTSGVLVWLYLRHPTRYLGMRRTLAIVTAMAMVVHLAYPLAPPGCSARRRWSAPGSASRSTGRSARAWPTSSLPCPR